MSYDEMLYLCQKVYIFMCAINASYGSNRKQKRKSIAYIEKNIQNRKTTQLKCLTGNSHILFLSCFWMFYFREDILSFFPCILLFQCFLKIQFLKSFRIKTIFIDRIKSKYSIGFCHKRILNTNIKIRLVFFILRTRIVSKQVLTHSNNEF